MWVMQKNFETVEFMRLKAAVTSYVGCYSVQFVTRTSLIMLFLLFALFSLLTNETGSVIMRVDYLYFQSTVLEKTRLFNTDQMRIFDPHNI